MEIIYEKTKGRIPLRLLIGKTKPQPGCGVQRFYRSWVLNLAGSWSFLLRDFRKKKAIWEFQKKNPTFKARLSAKHMLIGQLHDDVILLQLQIKAIVL